MASYETNSSWWTVASSADGKKFIAGLHEGLAYISTNLGVTWTATAHTDRWTSAACSWDGGKIVAVTDDTVGTGGTGKIYVSPPLSVPSPSLSMFRTPTNAVVVHWPSPSTNWELQQSTNVIGPNWNAPSEIIGDDGTNRFIVVNPPAGNRFYRLFKP